METKIQIIDIISSCSDGYIRIWDYNSNFFKYAIFSGYEGWLVGLCLIDQKYLLVGCGNGSIKEFNFNTKRLIATLNRKKNPYNVRLFTIKCYEINSIRYLISHLDDGMIEIWEEEI